MKRKIRVSSFDFDNCIFHLKYKWDKNNPDESAVISQNLALLESIRAQNGDFDEHICMVGSNRQSKYWDDQLSAFKPAPTESCFAAIEKISAFLDVTFHPFLMADIYGNLPDGESFRKARDDAKHLSHANWVCDKSKLSILYAQMHKVASQYPDDQVIFDFYDDKRKGAFKGKMDPLLENLERYFTQFPDMIPKNVTLRLHHYEGNQVTPYTPIQGSGIIDTDYRKTVIEMTKIAQKNGIAAGSMYSFVDCVRPEDLKNRTSLMQKRNARHGYAGLFNPVKASLEDNTHPGHHYCIRS